MKIDCFDGEYAFLSNFYPSPIAPFNDGIVYPTVEHAFQAYKTTDINKRKEIAAQPTPGKAKHLGRHVELRDDWQEIRINVMYTALKEKFKDLELQTKLLSTGDAELIEGNTWSDNFWGDCHCPKCRDIKGENNLGKLLMKIREDYKN